MRLQTFWGTPLKAAIASAAMLVAAACGSSASTPASHPVNAAASPTQALSLCQHVDGLYAALHELTPVHGALTTSSQMKAAAQDIQTSLAGLSNRTEWQTQINNLKTAVANMQTAAGDLAASPGAGGVTHRATTAVAQVNDSIRRLLVAVGARCPSPAATAPRS